MEFFTEKEVAAILKCSRQHVNTLIQERTLTAVDIAAKGMQRHCWRVSDAELERFLIGRQSVKPVKRPARAKIEKIPNYF